MDLLIRGKNKQLCVIIHTLHLCASIFYLQNDILPFNPEEPQKAGHKIIYAWTANRGGGGGEGEAFDDIPLRDEDEEIERERFCSCASL